MSPQANGLTLEGENITLVKLIVYNLSFQDSLIDLSSLLIEKHFYSKINHAEEWALECWGGAVQFNVM